VAATVIVRRSGWAAPSQAARGRAGLVPDVLDAYPDVTVVASKVALAYLKGLTHRPFTERAVKGGDKVGPVARIASHCAHSRLCRHRNPCRCAPAPMLTGRGRGADRPGRRARGGVCHGAQPALAGHHVFVRPQDRRAAGQHALGCVRDLTQTKAYMHTPALWWECPRSQHQKCVSLRRFASCAWLRAPVRHHLRERGQQPVVLRAPRLEVTEPHLCCAGVMFTCDAFGAHYCTDDAFDSELEALAPHYRFYYDCLMCALSVCARLALRVPACSCAPGPSESQVL